MKKGNSKREWKGSRFLGAAILAMVLSGCSLARPESGGADREIGLFIMDEETDSWLEENQPARGRIYADLILEEGAPSAADFGGLAGTYSMVYRETGPEEGDALSLAALTGDDMTDVHLSVMAGDTEEIRMESALLLPAGGGEHALFFRHIYETADGRIYLNTEREEAGLVVDETGSASSLFFDRQQDGRAFSFTLDIRIVTPDEILILGQYKEDGGLLREEICSPESLPEELAWMEDAAYLLVRRDRADGTSLYEAYAREVPETAEARYRGPVEAYVLENGRLTIHSMELEPEE